MHHLAAAVVELQPAGDPARRAQWQAAFDPVGIGEEENELHIAGLVLHKHAEGRLCVAALRTPMLRDPDLQHDHRVHRREMEEEIDDARLGAGRRRAGEQPVEQFGGLGTDAGQSRDTAKKGSENVGTHGGGSLVMRGRLSCCAHARRVLTYVRTVKVNTGVITR